ncbi:MAG TPA: LamG-like jellyroll fold domain-containing protein, partial [Pilimelia sp.]|nr:LamG-like jellyroll fold domain-containing protein [Pilimelia sp.]
VRLTDKLDHYAAVTQSATTNHSWSLRYDGVNDRWSFYILKSEAQATPTVFSLGGPSPVAGTWYHLVGVFDDAIDNTRLYVNGAASGANGTGTYTDADEWNATGAVQLGQRQLNGTMGRRLKGGVDDVRTYQRVLTQTDAQRLYAQTAPTPYLSWQFSEGSGSSVADSSGNGLTGTQDDTNAWTSAGHTGSAYHNSAGTSGRTASAAVVTPADNSYTAAGWVYLTDTSVTRTAFSTDGQNVSAYAVQYYQPTGRWAVHMRGSDANAAATSRAESIGAAQANTWVHLAVVYDDPADQLRLYVNGGLAGTPATVTADWTNGWNFFVVGRAKDNGAGTQYWRGSVDDVRAFRSALTGDAVRTLMGAVPPLPVVAVSAPLAARQTGALQGAEQGMQSSTAVAFNGNGAAHNPIQYANPSAFTVSGWFRATGTAGGSLIGFSSSTTAMSGDSTDRVVYLDSGGRITFAVSPAGVQSVRSTAAYNDGAWHHVAASLGAGGMRLYVDGVQVAGNASVTSAGNVSGYWRWGGTRLTGLPNAPGSSYFVGTLDEVAVFGSQLTDRQVAIHYHANH